jgi:hypothetical protein
MLIQNVDGLTPPYHVQSGIGKALIATGAAREVVPILPATFPQTTWQAREGYRGADYVESPIIAYSCASCGQKGLFSGPSCEKTQRFYHCNTAEEVPSDIQRTFRTLRIAWDRRNKSRAGKVSAFTSNPNNLEITGVQDLRKK